MSSKSYVKASYEVKASDMEKAAIAIARGQSIGNPSIKANGETKLLEERFCAKYDYGKNWIKIRWPKRNFGKEGVNYLLSVLMGGQCDIDLIEQCRLTEVDLSKIERRFPTPRYGVEGIRKALGVYGRPLIGGILKPKIGMTPQQAADVAKQMADGGVDFIKEDEILADQPWCPMKKRLPLVAEALESYKVVYAACITGDAGEAVRKAVLAEKLGASCVHANIWCGLGTHLAIRKRVKIPVFFQKSGDRVWTTGPYSIDYAVICKLVNLIGCDFAHVGMYGGYLAEPVSELKKRITALGNTIPSFSCGMRPELVATIRQTFGDDWMATSGGYICGHKGGVTAAVREFREAVA